MSTLPDYEIALAARYDKLISPFSLDQLNPASYDVVLGRALLVETEEGGWAEVDISQDRYELSPGEFVLAHTEESLLIPPKLEAVFCLKSSRGREGYNHALAAYIDPGFVGRVTLELKNYSRYRNLPLKAGMRIGQIRFTTMQDEPCRNYSYTGRYQGAETVEASKG